MPELIQRVDIIPVAYLAFSSLVNSTPFFWNSSKLFNTTEATPLTMASLVLDTCFYNIIIATSTSYEISVILGSSIIIPEILILFSNSYLNSLFIISYPPLKLISPATIGSYGYLHPIYLIAASI